RSPWQRAYVERVIGTIRRECLDHLIVFNERSLHRHLQAFVDYYHQNRVHFPRWKRTIRARPQRKPADAESATISTTKTTTSIIVITVPATMSRIPPCTPAPMTNNVYGDRDEVRDDQNQRESWSGGLRGLLR